MTAKEQSNLLHIAKLRERTTKSGLAEVGAQLLVDLDKQLDSDYAFNSDAVWQEAKSVVDQAVSEAQAKIQERSHQLGIPDRFAPRISHTWTSQGEQAIKERKIELRQMARRQVDAMIKSAKRKVEEISCDAQTKILASSFSSEAQALLDAMPSAEQLMPKLNLGELENMLGNGTGCY
jgi:hypothetical protein